MLLLLLFRGDNCNDSFAASFSRGTLKSVKRMTAFEADF